MQINPTLPQRRSLRLKGYDYSQAGVYFVTICAQEKICLFGEIVNDEMLVNELGTIVAAEWEKSAEIRSEIELGPYVIMPNHFHGIILIVDPDWSPVPNLDATPPRRGDRRVARSEPVPAHGPQCDRGAEGDPLPPILPSPGDPPVAPTIGPRPRSVGALMAGYKSAVTKRINTVRNLPGTPVWQRNYYEHVIRGEDDYHRIIEYISTNPQRWLEDSLHPNKVTAITKSKRNTPS
jgi:REP element-mobilizing transposase RayT